MSKQLNKKISSLKTEIQGILNALDEEEVLERVEQLTNEKNIKLSELQKAHNNYIIELELEKEIKKENDYKKVCRTSDTFEYTRLKNHPNRNELLNSFKDKRQKAKEDFDNFKKLEEEYSALDSKNVPGFLFFNKDVIDAYTLCPYIRLEGDFENNRKEWLNKTLDKGEKYYSLYNIVINESNYKSEIELKQSLEMTFDRIQESILTDSQKGIYTNTLVMFQEYLDCSVKTKKVKDKFKIIINNISILVNETGLPINDYWSLRYDNYIPINTLNDDVKKYTLDRTSIFVIDEYTNNIIKYSKVIDNIVHCQKYITNVKKHLKQELYEYLTNSKPVIEKQIPNYVNKKWSELKAEEKTERLESFSKYYVNKFLVCSNLIPLEEKETTVEKLISLLKISDIKFKDLKWNVKGGMIERIGILKWDDTKKSLFIEKTEVKPKDKVPQKRCSIKTLFTNANEEVINEEIVKFIVSKLNSKNVEINTKESKETLLENVKVKLQLKRITVNDKLQIFKKFDDIYSVISQN
jgi:hypothetical protein